MVVGNATEGIGDMPDSANLSDYALVDDLTAAIADEMGDRLRGGSDDQGIPAVRDWRQTSEDTAEFWFTDGRHVVVTVKLSE